VNRAAELLRKTDKSVLQIALEVGFSDQSYFTKVFRRHHRMTPRQYRLARAGE
jgi:AraC-like DNA-binding protein